jgi:hypothetical protein
MMQLPAEGSNDIIWKEDMWFNASKKLRLEALAAFNAKATWRLDSTGIYDGELQDTMSPWLGDTLIIPALSLLFKTP